MSEAANGGGYRVHWQVYTKGLTGAKPPPPSFEDFPSRLEAEARLRHLRASLTMGDLVATITPTPPAKPKRQKRGS